MFRRFLSRLLFWAVKGRRLSSNEIARLAILALKDSNMDLEDRSLCTAALLNGLNALPLRSIISTNEQGVLLINGKVVEREKFVQLSQSAKSALDSTARRLINDQVTYAAVEMAVHKALTTDQIMFAKAALWYIKEEESLYRLLAGEETSPGLPGYGD